MESLGPLSDLEGLRELRSAADAYPRSKDWNALRAPGPPPPGLGSHPERMRKAAGIGRLLWRICQADPKLSQRRLF